MKKITVDDAFPKTKSTSRGRRLDENQEFQDDNLVSVALRDGISSCVWLVGLGDCKDDDDDDSDGSLTLLLVPIIISSIYMFVCSSLWTTMTTRMNMTILR